MTNRELLDSGISVLKEAGIEDAETDARILFEYVTGLDRSALLLHGGDEISEEHISPGHAGNIGKAAEYDGKGMADDGKAGPYDGKGMSDDKKDGAGSGKGGQSVKEIYDSLIAERAGHRPVQYITGMADFMGLRFRVNENVLIPRFDTEFLVEEMMREVGDGSAVLDMCTGSGCILLSLMRYKNGIKGTGADISRAALETAEENEKLIFGPAAAESPDAAGMDPADGNGFYAHGKAEWILSDMFEGITERYDYIVCNPPYIRSDEIGTLMPEVRDHEPHRALDGDADGLKYYRIIAKEAGKYLRKYGKLFLETGYDEGKEVSALLEESGFSDIQVLKDYSGNDRVVIAVKTAE